MASGRPCGSVAGVALKDIPRVPLWQILGVITLAMIVGALGTVFGSGHVDASAGEIVLAFVPPFILAVLTVVFRVRERGRPARLERQRDAKAEASDSSKDSSGDASSDPSGDDGAAA